MRYEWRRDYLEPAIISYPMFRVSCEKDQNTATLGLVWWWGRKQGAW